MMIPREFDDANRRKKLERTPEQIQIANLKAEIKRLTDLLEEMLPHLGQRWYPDIKQKYRDKVKAALKEQDND